MALSSQGPAPVAGRQALEHCLRWAEKRIQHRGRGLLPLTGQGPPEASGKGGHVSWVIQHWENLISEKAGKRMPG